MLISFDTETELSTPGRYVPRGVVASFADEHSETLQWIAEGLRTFEGLLRPGVTIAGAHNAYDNAVACAERPDLTAAVFKHYDRQGFHDILIGQALDHVAKGHLFKDPDGVSKMRLPPSDHKPNGEVKSRYGLELVTWQRLGRHAKVNDLYRKRYGDLKAVPMEQWPREASQYPKDDTRNTYDCAADQIAKAANMGPLVRVIPSVPPQQWEAVRVRWPGDSEDTVLTHMGLNAYAGFCLHLLSAWGLRVGAEPLKRLIQRVEAKHAEEVERFVKIGLLKPDGKDNGTEIKRRLIRAYNPGRADLPCPDCKGTGKVKSPKTSNPINCKVCSATGLQIGQAPTTPTDGVCADRDACSQSGDQDLADLKASSNRKLRDTFVPFLIDGVIYPINVPSNVLVATARTSFGKQDEGGDDAPGLLQTFPREGGARECIVAPEGWVMCSNDWNALEFANLGQAQKWVCGYSPILDAINAGKDAHAILGAKMLSISYDAFMACLKDPATKAFYKMIRQGTKAGNFGFGGRMGAARFAWTQRRQKIGGHGSMCRLMGRESAAGCNSERISVWKKRPCPPVCLQCVEVSEELRLGWLDLWCLKEYFDWVDAHDGIQDSQGVMVSPGTGYVRGGLNVSAGCNQPFQHLGGYGSKLALCLVMRECYNDFGTALYGCRPIIFAHDEIITLMPEHKAAEAAKRQTELMEYAMRIICPDAKIGIAPALMRSWWKEAEDCYKDPNCPTCKGTGWLYGEFEGKANRFQCKPCKTNGRLSVWEPFKASA